MSSITINTKDFSDPNFNAKTWINSVLRPPTIQTERISTDDEEGEGGTAKNTTILVTKLQMASESASRQFDQLSTTVMKSMPRVLYDLKLIADDAKAAHEGVEAVKKNLGLIEGDTEAALEKLRKPHIAKTRMEECRMLLLEKSDHLNKLREEKERKQKIEQEAAAAAAAAEEARVQAAKEESEKQQLLAQQQEEEEQRLRQEEEAARREMEAKQMEPVLEEKKVIDEALEYGHVQLPPLRQPPPKQRTLQQIQNAAISAKEEDDSNSYLQQISESMTPQVSNVFKRIGVPLDKFWQ